MEIPKVIYFCNKTLDKMKEYSDNWKRLNPEYEIRLSDNTMCENFLLREYSPLHRNIFRFIKDGPIKADFWRICILNKYGGVYSDIDNVPFLPIRAFVEPGVNFVTCSAYMERVNFNPNFIMSHKNNTILEKCIEWYIHKYTKRHKYSYWQWSIMKAFTDILHLDNYRLNDGIFYLNQDRENKENKENQMKIQILKECRGRNHYDDHNVYNGKRVFNNRYKDWNSDKHCFKSNADHFNFNFKPTKI